MEKADKVFVRIGFTDVIVPIDDQTIRTDEIQSYTVGYEDEEGRECDEDGYYF